MLLLLLNIHTLHADTESPLSFLLKANEETSFMHYEFHNLAYEAAQKKEYKHAFELYLKAANKGDNRAEYNVGMMYMKGIGVERAKMNAYKWLRRASKHGNKEATLYFKQMNERYEKAQQEKPSTEKTQESTPASEPDPEKETNPTPVIPEIKPDPVPAVTAVKVDKKEPKMEEGSPLLYILIALVVLIFSLSAFFMKKTDKPKKKKKEKAPQKELKYKSQMFDITYKFISDYHEALLQQVNLAKIKHDPKKLQIYYMFLYGMIDYFCQLEKFNDSDQRRIFTTHMREQVGKENVTAVTQSILEGQRDPSMYHYQAAGGISAKAWHENGSKDALSMLKKVLTEKRD